MSKYPQNTMHAKIMYGWTNRGRTNGHRTFAPVDLTAPKVAAGKNFPSYIIAPSYSATFGCCPR